MLEPARCSAEPRPLVGVPWGITRAACIGSYENQEQSGDSAAHVAKALTGSRQLAPSCCRGTYCPVLMNVSIGDQVRLIGAQPFLKTADPMPMLRPLISWTSMRWELSSRCSQEIPLPCVSPGTFLKVEALTVVEDQVSS